MEPLKEEYYMKNESTINYEKLCYDEINDNPVLSKTFILLKISRVEY